ncbi:hypothetical protein VNI00_007768 [Paramarasmius palmivorus]|uniref:BTB domain-containing protein n=1 Tax=Paramarasmius palmivorus TaxID=297713 RepID=A0AAW0D132_9AGAR
MQSNSALLPPALTEPQAQRRKYPYKHGRDFYFCILVQGEDFHLEVPAALMCLTSEYFSHLAIAVTAEDEDVAYVEVDVDRFSVEVVWNVLELVYHIDVPDQYLKKLAEPCKSENRCQRRTALNDFLAVLGLACEWRMGHISYVIQHAFIQEQILQEDDIEYGTEEHSSLPLKLTRLSVQLVAKHLNACMLEQGCEDFMEKFIK